MVCLRSVQQILQNSDEGVTYMINGSGCKLGTLPSQFASKDMIYGKEELGFGYHEINK